METRLIAALLFASLLVSVGSIAPNPRDEIRPLLNSALTDATCRVTFETDFMNAMISIFPSTSPLLSPRIADMQADKSQLIQYAGQGDAMNYSMYVQEKFSKHLKQNGDAIKAGIDSLKPNGTGGGGGGGGGPGDGAGGGTGEGGGGGTGVPDDELKASMESLASTYKSLMEAQANCFDTKEYAHLVINYYDNALNRYESRAQNMSDRGINVSNLQTLVGNARSDTLTPLQNGVNSATNSSQLRILLNQRCLYDACMNGTNFHMAAKFEAMKTADLLAVMSPKAAEAGHSSDVAAVQASLSAAKWGIDSWGTKEASPDQLRAVWSDIRSAAKGSHDLFIALNGTAGAD